MTRKMNDTQKLGIVLAAFCVLFAAYILFASAVSGGNGSAHGLPTDNPELIQRFDNEGDIMPIDISDNALILTDDKVNTVSLSYKKDGEWVEITEGSSDLPADAVYQLKIE